ncbi:cyclophilin-like fold protein [Lentzea jiangxiensis]|nr:cyclophilin-like fold protein [Lentzea jiangxiensis]
MLMPASRAVARAVLLTVAGVTAAGCGGTPSTSSGSAQDADRSSTAAASQPGGTSRDADSSPHQEEQMKMQITIGDQRLQATIFDSAAGRDLITQLPLTIDMVDHGSVEKTGPLPAPLSRDGQPDGADPDIGDVGYYAPGNDLVFYYGDQSYYSGIVIIGRLDGDAANLIADLDGAITATAEVHTG